MKTPIRLVSTILGLLLATAGTASAETLQLSAGFGNIQRTGTSGGASSSNCGYIPSAANYELVLSQDFALLTLAVSGGGSPTLLVRGAGDSAPFCATEHSGYWEAGTYEVFVGDRAGANSGNSYTLSISETPLVTAIEGACRNINDINCVDINGSRRCDALKFPPFHL